MKLYFDFYNETETKYLCITDTNNRVNTKFKHFNLNAYIEKNFELDYEKITDFFLIIEKEVNGEYVFDKSYKGELDSNGMLQYSNCLLDESIINSAKFRLYFQFNDGGVVVYNGKDKSIFIDLKSKCENFKIEIYNTIKIGDVYEVQDFDSDLPTITFKMKILNSNHNGNYKYHYQFSNNNKSPNNKTFKPLNGYELEVTDGITIDQFKDGILYLHFSLKDSFDNVTDEVYRIASKDNTLTLFEIVNTEVSIKDDSEFGIFYKKRNVNSIKPIVKVTNNKNITKKIISEKEIGLLNKDKNFVNMKLSDYFNEDFSNKKVELFFRLNNKIGNDSNSMMIYLDSKSPTIEINNFDKNNYKLITDQETQMVKVSGRIEDDNFFFLGNSRQKINIDNAEHYLIIYDKNNQAKYVDFGNGKKEMFKCNYYNVAKTESENFIIYDDNGNKISNYEYVNDYVNDGSKNLYIIFDEKELSQYEKNLIINNDGLKIKSKTAESFIKKQAFFKFASLYCIKAEIDTEAKGNYNFDVGVKDFGYSFIHKINYSNISCFLNNKKQMNLGFKDTLFLIIKNNKNVNISKIAKNKVVSTQTTYTCGELTFTGVSLNENEYFSPDGEFMFLDEGLNTFAFEDIYSQPEILDSNKVSLLFYDYKVEQIEKNVYLFSFNLPIENGINRNLLEFSDIVGNKAGIEFVIEKNYKPIKIEIDDLYNKTFEKKELSLNKYELTTNKKNIYVKFVINNENLRSKNKDTYLTVKSDNTIKKQKILLEEDKRVAYIELSNINKVKESYKVFYSEEVRPSIVFDIVQSDKLMLKTEPTFTTGFTPYFLSYQIDNFADLKLRYDISKFKCEIKKNNIISITKLNSSTFIEKINLELIASDKHNLYNPITKVVKGTFYNGNVINNYWIDNLHNNKLIDPEFDLVLRSFENDNLEYIKYYDALETNISKRVKVAEYNPEDNTYKIKGIVSPIKPSYLNIMIKIKDEDIIIHKRLFEENLISLYYEKNELDVVCIKENKLHIRLINKINQVRNYNRMEVFESDNLIDQFNNIKFDQKHLIRDFYIDRDKLFGINDLTFKLYNEFDKMIFTTHKIIDFNDYADHECFVNNLNIFNVMSVSETEVMKVTTEKFRKGEYFINIKDAENNSKTIPIVNNQFYPHLNAGQYSLELCYKEQNYQKKLYRYYLEVLPDDFEHIDYSREYSKFLKINTIIVKSMINTGFDKLDPKIYHYCNDELIKVYDPVYVNDHIEFNIIKGLGVNDFYYKDNFKEKKLESYISKKNIPHDSFEIYAINTKHKALFYEDSTNSITLDNLEDLHFKTKNADTMYIKTNRVTSNIKRVIINDIETTVFKSFIPCTLEFYSLGSLVKTIKIKLRKTEFVRMPFFSPSKNNGIERFDIKISNNAAKIHNTKAVLMIKHTAKHFLYSYVYNLAMLIPNKTFLDSTYDKQEKYIRELCNQYFEEFKNNDTEALKKYIKNKMGGSN